MPIDIVVMRPDVRARYARVGNQFRSETVLAQTDKTLGAYRSLGAVLVDHGFTADDAAELGEVRGLLAAGLAERESARGNAKTSSADARRAERSGRGARQQLRVVLTAARGAGERRGAGVELSTAIDTALDLTAVTPRDPHALATQLDVLITATQRPEVQDLAAPRGGAAAIAAGEAARALLNAGDVISSATSTEKLDVLDGIAVELCRAARSAAKSAARASNAQALVAAFALDVLYAESHAAPSTPKPTA